MSERALSPYCRDRNDSILRSPRTHCFADVAHQSVIFDSQDECSRLVLDLIDTRWVQRLRDISQTGNTRLVYMFAEHSRFGHSIGVAYLASLLMTHLSNFSPRVIAPFRSAVAAAALLHDIGHVAPGSHLAERVWAPGQKRLHEVIGRRVVMEDRETMAILERYDPELPGLVAKVIEEDPSLPSWTTAVLSGGGWNADRGNWAIVDSAMCSVSYGRYNVLALIDAFRVTDQGELVLQENRLDALTHFFVARDSMYRQVYQHRVLQAADVLTANIVRRVRELANPKRGTDSICTKEQAAENLRSSLVYCDRIMLEALHSKNYALEMNLEDIFRMRESWWNYHVEQWTNSRDSILSDLATRLRDRVLFKTIRVETKAAESGQTEEQSKLTELLDRAKSVAADLGYDPEYYVSIIDSSDTHRGLDETAPMVLLDSGEAVPVTMVEPMIAQIMERSSPRRVWIVVPKSVKEKMGRIR